MGNIKVETQVLAWSGRTQPQNGKKNSCVRWNGLTQPKNTLKFRCVYSFIGLAKNILPIKQHNLLVC